jgi:tetratricopeptide (TPR) repeat protein
MAAAIAHMANGPSSRTVVTYGMGYAGFETALIRLAKGRFRAVCCDGGACPGGAAFDDLILRTLACEHPALRQWPAHMPAAPDYSLAWRNIAQQFKERVCSAGEASLQIHDSRIVRISRQSFHRAIENSISGTMESAVHAIQESNMALADIDEVLLLGGSAVIEPVRRLAERWFDRPATRLDEFSMAEGAALYGARLDAPSAFETVGVAAADTAEVRPKSLMPVEISSGSEVEPGDALVFASPATPVIAGFSAPQALDPLSAALEWRRHVVDHARSLIAAGEREAAASFLQDLLGEVQELLNAMSAPQRARMKKESEWLLTRAREMLKAKRLETAIEHAHRAYAVDKETPAVFGEMIEIHCAAAAAELHFDNAIRWLMCAQEHDRTNPKVHATIAERYYKHARDLSDRDDKDAAISALEECLCFEPEHAPAQALKAVLAGARRPRPATEGV